MPLSGQAPLPAEHGRFLVPGSVSGSKLPFVQTTQASTGKITLQATGNASLQDFGYFAMNFSYTLDGNILNWPSVVGWCYTRFFIDNAASDYVDTNRWRLGATAAATRAKMSINIIEEPDYYPTDVSTRTYYFCQNLDSASHTVGAIVAFKYLRTGDAII